MTSYHIIVDNDKRMREHHHLVIIMYILPHTKDHVVMTVPNNIPSTSALHGSRSRTPNHLTRLAEPLNTMRKMHDIEHVWVVVTACEY